MLILCINFTRQRRESEKEKIGTNVVSYYFMANIRINDAKEYQKYLNKVDEIFSKFNGKYLAVDQHPQVVEGKWNYTRAVLIKFASKPDFEEWYNSIEYQQILGYRLNGAICDSILIKENEEN